MRATVGGWMAVGAYVVYTSTVGAQRALAAPRTAEETLPGTAPARQGQQPVRRFDLAAGPLEAALSAWENVTGVKVTVAAEALRGLDTFGASGEYTNEQALQQLLRGTGVAYRFTSQTTVSLQLRRQESIEVTASLNRPATPKLTEPLREVPQTIVVVPSAVIREQNATTLREVLRNVPGITMQAGEGGVPAGDQMSIRGFSSRTDIFVDGVRDFGGYSRDPFNVEQIEVAKGPASTLVGRGSTGGSINLVSKTPQGDVRRDVAVGLGSSAYKRGTIDFNQPLATVGLEGAALRLNALWTDADVARRDEVTNRRWGLAPSLVLGLGRPTRLTLSYFRLGQDNVPDYGQPWVNATSGPLAAYNGGRPPVEADRFYGLLSRDYERTDTDLATATIERDFGAPLQLRNQLRYGRTRRDSVITAPRFANVTSPTQYDEINRQLQSRDMTDTIVSNQLSLQARFDTGRIAHALAAGFEVAREGSENFLRTGPTAPVADLFDPDPTVPYSGPITRTGAVNDGEADSLTAYAFDTVHVTPRLELTGGLRFDRFDVEYLSTPATGATSSFTRRDDMWSWKAGAVFKPRPNGSLYAGAGNSFNPSAEGLALAVATAELAPEETRSYEVGSKWDLAGGRLAVTGALFRTEKTNARTPGVNAGDPPQVLRGVQRVDGAEIGAQGNLGDRLTVFAGYTHMRSEIEASGTPSEVGNALAQTPEDTFNVWATVRLTRRLTAGGGAQYMDTVYRNAINTLQAPGYWLFNGTAAYEANRRLTLRLNAHNLANEDYVDRVGGGHFIPGPGRSVTVTAELDF
jgi:catecholate siderophore receptor